MVSPPQVLTTCYSRREGKSQESSFLNVNVSIEKSKTISTAFTDVHGLWKEKTQETPASIILLDNKGIGCYIGCIGWHRGKLNQLRI
jgi:hypothetical protein